MLALKSDTPYDDAGAEEGLIMRATQKLSTSTQARLAVGAFAAAGAFAILGAADTAQAQSTHTVRSGETLSQIASQYGRSVNGLVQANSISNPDQIAIGEVLRIPGATSASGATKTSATTSTGQVPRGSAVDAMFDTVGNQVGVSPSLLRAVMWQESGWQNNVTSSVGAQGIAQVMPSTVSYVNENLTRSTLDPAVDEDNIRIGALYLRYLLNQTGWDTEQAIAAYYQGLTGLRNHGMYKDTQSYVRNVLALQQRHF